MDRAYFRTLPKRVAVVMVFWPNADKVKVGDSPREASGCDGLLCEEGENQGLEELEVAAEENRDRGGEWRGKIL